MIRLAEEPGDPLPPELRAACELAESVSVALLRGPQVIGIQVAGRRHTHDVFAAPRHDRIARGIAQLASLALENARLVGQLEQASRLKSDFLATMSHELRTPLNVILGYNELLVDEVFGTLTPEQAASLDRVGTSARELLELISATLDISRLETGRAALNLQDIDPAALLREIEAETRRLLEKPGVETIWRVAPDLPHALQRRGEAQGAAEESDHQRSEVHRQRQRHGRMRRRTTDGSSSASSTPVSA